MNLLHLIVRQWRKRPARTLLSVLSVSIAVAAVLGSALAQSSVREGGRNLTQALEGRPALDIVSSTGERIVPSTVPSLADIPGVVAAFPIASRATLARIHGKRLRSIVVGLPLESADVWGALTLASGRACQGPGEVLLVAELAESFNAHLGDRLTLLSRRGPHSVKIVGLVNARALNDLAPAATLAMPLDAVQELFSLDEQVDRVRVLVATREQRSRIQGTLSARLPDSLVVQWPAQQIEEADTVLRSTELALQFSGGISLAMAAFIILNTLRMNFGERRRDVAVLRVLGATSNQLVVMHLVEGTCMGLFGSLLGVPLGLVLGRGLGRVMQRVLDTPIAAPETAYGSVALAIALGPVVACLAAIVPALQARKVGMQEAMGDTEPRRSERFPRWALLATTALILAASGLMLLVMLGYLPSEGAIPVGLLLLVSFIVLIPAVLRPVVRLSAWILSPWLKMEGDLAAEQLLGRPVRTGLTAGVLVVALNTGLGLGNAIVNNVNDVSQWYERWLSSEVSLFDPAVLGGAATAQERPDVREQIESQPNVAHVVETRFFPARAKGVPAQCTVRNFVPGMELPWAVSAGDKVEIVNRLRNGEVVLSSVLAKKLALEVGDPVRVELSGRAFSLRIAALANDYMFGGMSLYLDQDAARQMITLGPAAMYLVQAKPDTPPDALLQGLKAVGANTGLVVHSFPQLRQQFDRVVNGIVGALWGLLLVGFVVGGVAVSNTLTMSVLEQTREIGLLRIVGMTRGQIRKLIFCESLLMGILGTLMGSFAGVITALIIHLVTEPLMGRSIPFAFHGTLFVANVVGCLLVAAVAGWSPGERAARLDLLAAIAYE